MTTSPPPLASLISNPSSPPVSLSSVYSISLSPLPPASPACFSGPQAALSDWLRKISPSLIDDPKRNTLLPPGPLSMRFRQLQRNENFEPRERMKRHAVLVETVSEVGSERVKMTKDTDKENNERYC